MYYAALNTCYCRPQFRGLPTGSARSYLPTGAHFRLSAPNPDSNCASLYCHPPAQSHQPQHQRHQRTHIKRSPLPLHLINIIHVYSLGLIRLPIPTKGTLRLLSIQVRCAIHRKSGHHSPPNHSSSLILRSPLAKLMFIRCQTERQVDSKTGWETCRKTAKVSGQRRHQIKHDSECSTTRRLGVEMVLGR